MNKPFFISAQPIWPEQREKDVNLLVGFHCKFELKEICKVRIRIAAATIYRLFCNGVFVGHGPARAAHGYYRVDEWDLAADAGVNHIAIEIAGYNTPSYAYLDQPSFLQAEIIDTNGKILASTNAENACFTATILPQRKQVCDRYSIQRTFCEIYKLQPDYNKWHTTGITNPVKCASFETKKLLERAVSYPKFNKVRPQTVIFDGKLEKMQPAETLTLLDEMENLKTINRAVEDKISFPSKTINIQNDTFKIFDFGQNLCGFIGFSITCTAPTRILLVYDEIMIDDDVLFMRQSALNTVSCELTCKGDYKFETIEPYVMKYLKVIVLNGDCTLNDLYFREFANPDTDGLSLDSKDDELNLIFEAGRQSLRQNALDLFMDCPGRERAGWIGDTYYTAKAAAYLMDNIQIETNQFENYALPKKFPDIPSGALPMCYPAEYPKGRFIPTFCFWFVMQLEEYAQRGGDIEIIRKLKPRVLKVFEYFKKFKNELGLLESLESWVFIEWSEAKNFVQDVNIPANLLYLQALRATGELYAIDTFTNEADYLAKTIYKTAFDGRFFMDNLIREGGKLIPTSNYTEICQYLAFKAKVLTPETHPELWQILLEINENPQTKLHERNVLFGECLRMELLSNYGYIDQLLKEIRKTFYPMAVRTGTLWEKFDERTSCNHGFTAYIAYLLRLHAS